MSASKTFLKELMQNAWCVSVSSMQLHASMYLYDCMCSGTHAVFSAPSVRVIDSIGSAASSGLGKPFSHSTSISMVYMSIVKFL